MDFSAGVVVRLVVSQGVVVSLGDSALGVVVFVQGGGAVGAVLVHGGFGVVSQGALPPGAAR